MIAQHSYTFNGNRWGQPPEPKPYGEVNSWEHINPTEIHEKLTVGVSVFIDLESNTVSKIAFYGYVAGNQYLGSNPSLEIFFINNDKPLESQILLVRGTGDAEIINCDESGIIEHQYSYTESDIPEDIGRTFRQKLFPLGTYNDDNGTMYKLYIQNNKADLEI